MRKIDRSFKKLKLLLLCLLFILSLSICSRSLAIERAIRFPITDGVFFNHLQIDTAGCLLNINWISVDLNSEKIKVEIASATTGLEHTSSIAGRTGAIAAINGGYFNYTPPEPVGLVIDEGKILSLPLADRPPRAAIGFTPDNKVFFDRVGIKDGCLFSLDTTADWRKIPEALGAGPQLIKDGKILVTAEEEGFSVSFNTTRHPRTAVGITKDNQLILLTVDGRQPGVSDGISLTDLAQLMLNLGASEAINLDGGGSTTMVIFNTIVNYPSDKDEKGQFGKERPVANAIIVKEIKP